MPVTGPERCPECGYEPLTPFFAGQCPDCSFPFDPQTRIWRPKRPWRIYLLFANAILFLPWLFRFLQVVLIYHSWPSTPVTVGAAMSIILVIWAWPRLRVLLSDGHRYAATTPTELRARTPRDAYAAPWSDIAAIEVLAGIPMVSRHSTPDRRLLDWIFDTDEEVKLFVEEVEQRVAGAKNEAPER